MNFYRKQSYQTKELIDVNAFGTSMDSYIKREMIYEFFKDKPEYIDGGTFEFSFIQFDRDSMPTLGNVKYHHVIHKCMTDKLNFYELTVNILR